MILGPLLKRGDVPFPTVRLLRRFGTWEQHGGAQGPTVRLIDDALEGGQNGATGSQCTHRPTDLDSISHGARTLPNVSDVAVSMRFQKSVQAGTRRTKPGRLGWNSGIHTSVALCFWWSVPNLLVESIARRILREFTIGAATLGLHWQVWRLRIVSMTSLLLTDKQPFLSGWLLWRVLAACCGWTVLDAKKSLARTVPTHTRSNVRFVTNTRMITQRSQQRKTAGVAGKLWGHLGYSCAPMFGGYGRTKHRGFSCRQHEQHKVGLNHHLTMAG